MSVYFAEAGGYIKIGYSKNPLARVETITWSGTRPDDLPRRAEASLIGWVPGSTWNEGKFHGEHIEHRVAGEWFRLDRDYVADLIWQDPCGVDVRRMTAAAVFTFLNSPEGVTRADVEAAGVPIESRPLSETSLMTRPSFASDTAT